MNSTASHPGTTTITISLRDRGRIDLIKAHLQLELGRQVSVSDTIGAILDRLDKADSSQRNGRPVRNGK